MPFILYEIVEDRGWKFWRQVGPARCPECGHNVSAHAIGETSGDRMLAGGVTSRFPGAQWIFIVTCRLCHKRCGSVPA